MYWCGRIPTFRRAFLLPPSGWRKLKMKVASQPRKQRFERYWYVEEEREILKILCQVGIFRFRKESTENSCKMQYRLANCVDENGCNIRNVVYYQWNFNVMHLYVTWQDIWKQLHSPNNMASCLEGIPQQTVYFL